LPALGLAQACEHLAVSRAAIFWARAAKSNSHHFRSDSVIERTCFLSRMIS